MLFRSGERQRLGFVALSDASTQTGGLLATSLGLGGKPGDGSVTLASEVFAPRRSFAAFLKAPGDTSVLTHVRDLEFRYFGAKDANSPLQWHTDWHEAGQMPQLVSVAVEFSSQPGIWAGPWLVRLRQKL